MTKTDTTIELCKKSEVPDGEAFRVIKDDLDLAIYNVDGEYFVTNDACTHGPGSLSEGFLDGHIIECDFHGGCFDVRNGEVVTPPCMIPLRVYTVVPDPDNIVIILA